MTGDRVAEIRDRLDVGGLNKRDAADLAYLLAENARLRAQLDGVEAVADTLENLTPAGNYPEARTAVDAAGNAAEMIRAALNQGGETNGD